MESGTLARLTVGIITLTNICSVGVFYHEEYFHVYNPNIILTLLIAKLYWEAALSLSHIVIWRPFQNHSFQGRICHWTTMAYIIATGLCFKIWNTYGLFKAYRDGLPFFFIYCSLGIWSSAKSMSSLDVVLFNIYLF